MSSALAAAVKVFFIFFYSLIINCTLHVLWNTLHYMSDHITLQCVTRHSWSANAIQRNNVFNHKVMTVKDEKLCNSVKDTHLVSVARIVRNCGPGCSPGTRTDRLPARLKPWGRKITQIKRGTRDGVRCWEWKHSSLSKKPLLKKMTSERKSGCKSVRQEKDFSVRGRALYEKVARCY